MMWLYAVLGAVVALGLAVGGFMLTKKVKKTDVNTAIDQAVEKMKLKK